jgi:4-coumarate--CoA ligase
VLLAHPGVADASVRLMRPDEGDRLKAFVAPKNERAIRSQLRQELDAWVAERASAPERPRSFTFGSVLPTNAMGKPSDWLCGADDPCSAPGRSWL